jgi:hypothetical protein
MNSERPEFISVGCYCCRGVKLLIGPRCVFDKGIHFLLCAFFPRSDLLKVMSPACLKQICLKFCECDLLSDVADELRVPLCSAQERSFIKCL